MENKEARLIKIKEEIYITTDEEVKEGDWFLFYRDKWHIMNELPNGNFRKEAYGKTVCKIIATTDTKLNLPQPSQAFIEKYCEAGGIDEVLVEYEVTYEEDIINFKIVEIIKEKLKVNSHNEITIHPIKESWDREEITRLLSNISSYTHVHNRVVVGKELNNWIKENLS